MLPMRLEMLLGDLGKNTQVPKWPSRKMTSQECFQQGWQRLQSWCDCSNRIWNDSKRVGNAFGYFHKSWLPRRKPSRDLAKKEIGNASKTVGNESKRVENVSKRVGNESNIVGNAFEWFSKKFTSPKVVARKMLHKKVGNDYNHDGIVPIRLEDYPISIYPTALEYVLLSTLESVQLRWNLSDYFGICPIRLEYYLRLICPTVLKSVKLH